MTSSLDTYLHRRHLAPTYSRAPAPTAPRPGTSTIKAPPPSTPRRSPAPSRVAPAREVRAPEDCYGGNMEGPRSPRRS